MTDRRERAVERGKTCHLLLQLDTAEILPHPLRMPARQ